MLQGSATSLQSSTRLRPEYRLPRDLVDQPRCLRGSVAGATVGTLLLKPAVNMSLPLTDAHSPKIHPTLCTLHTLAPPYPLRRVQDCHSGRNVSKP